jgi:hypothetical protein
MTVYYIGVDPSIENTGVFVLNHHLAIESKLIVTRKELGHRVLRYAAIAEGVITEINKVCTRSDGSIICYEDYSFDSTHKAFSIGELGGVLKVALTQFIYYPTLYLVAPNTLKLFATGNGGASKELMGAKYLEEHVPETVLPSTDVVDAYYLALMAYYIGGKPTTGLLRRRVEVINKYLKSKIGKPIQL